MNVPLCPAPPLFGPMLLAALIGTMLGILFTVILTEFGGLPSLERRAKHRWRRRRDKLMAHYAGLGISPERAYQLAERDMLAAEREVEEALGP